MRIALRSLGLVTLIIAAPVAAAPALRGVMHSWKASTRSTFAMLDGQKKFDEGTVRSALQTYIDNAGQIAAEIHGQGGEARDIRGRFLSFQADAKAALNDVARPPALKADFTRLTGDCQSCHDAYNN